MAAITRSQRRRGGEAGSAGRFYVIYEEDGEPLGYARYRTREEDDNHAPAGVLGVQELMTATDSAYAGLWHYLFGVDLIGTIEARMRRVDEPLYWMLADPRRLVRTPNDSLWVRVVDVPAALEARRYAQRHRPRDRRA